MTLTTINYTNDKNRTNTFKRQHIPYSVLGDPVITSVCIQYRGKNMYSKLSRKSETNISELLKNLE